MLVSVVDVKPLSDYKLLLSFVNDEPRIFDMKPYLDKGFYRELINEDVFKSARISFDSVEWKNHADIDPEFLYFNSIPLEKHRGTHYE